MDPRANWPRIGKFSNSADEFERSFALVRATASLESALTAAGFPRHSPNQGLLDRVVRHGLFGRKGWPAERPFRAALDARNTAAHGGRGRKLAGPRACKAHVGILHQAWRYLRKQFVTKRTAANLAQRILENRRSTHVFLYGSLARAEREAKDIDLLILDDGELSTGVQYGNASEYLLDALDVIDDANRAAIHCDWLDVMAIDGVRFGHDPRYTRLVAKLQRDSLFFVNIAEDVIPFDPKSQRWAGKRPAVFQRLALLRGQLENEGIVENQKRANLPRREGRARTARAIRVGNNK